MAEKKGTTEIRKGSCPVCTYACHVNVHMQDGKIVRITGDSQSPRGKRLCSRAPAAVDYHYHPDRVNFPLKRVGERGEGKWERISWEQAMGEIGDKLESIRKRHGPEALAVLGGDNVSAADPAAWRFSNIWGTPNIFCQGKNCGEAEFIAECAIYGQITLGTLSYGTAGVGKGVIIMWGANPWEGRENCEWPGYLDSQKRGTKLRAVDPRRSKSAEAADIWLQLRPGTDGALAYGMANVIINEGLYDKEFVSKWCLGFDELKAHVQKYLLEKVEDITWVPKEKIAEAARVYATAKPGYLSFGVATCHTGSAALSAVAGKCILRAITGNLDVEGGNTLCANPELSAYLEEAHFDTLIDNPARTRDNVSAHVWPIASVKSLKMFREAQGKVLPRGAGMRQYFSLPSSRYIWSAVLDADPYPLKAVILAKSNPLLVLGNAKRIHNALKSPHPELLVSIERWLPPSNMLADYVLPSADNFERPDMDNMWGFANSHFVRDQVVEPLYQRRDDYYFWRDLGKRFGQAQYWPDTLEGFYDRILKPTGTTFRELLSRDFPGIMPPRQYKAYEKKGFATFSGKVELTSSFFRKMGLPALPDYQEPPWSPVSTPELAKEYPLILISGSRLRHMRHSQYRQLEKLRRKNPNPLLQINPETAGKLGIADGDPVYVETPVGRIRQKASVTDIVHPRVVHADGYWWYPEMPAAEPSLFGVWDSNINSIVPDDPEVCDYAGDNYFRALLCRVYKSKEL